MVASQKMLPPKASVPYYNFIRLINWRSASNPPHQIKPNYLSNFEQHYGFRISNNCLPPTCFEATKNEQYDRDLPTIIWNPRTEHAAPLVQWLASKPSTEVLTHKYAQSHAPLVVLPIATRDLIAKWMKSNVPEEGESKIASKVVREFHCTFEALQMRISHGESCCGNNRNTLPLWMVM